MTTPDADFNPLEEGRLYARVMWRLMPFLFLLYIFANLDRSNVAFAKLQMLQELRWSDAIYGIGAGLFYLGYAFCGPSSCLMLMRVGARRWIATLMIVWGLVSASMMFITAPWQFYTLRFLLGAAEGGFYPGVGLYLLNWIPHSHRARSISRLAIAVPISGMFGGPVSGKIMEAFKEYHGLAGWKWLFLLEGLPSTILGICVLFVLQDSIAKAGWLDAREKRFLSANLLKGFQPVHDLTFRQICAHPPVWYIGSVGFCGSAATAGLFFWLPQIIRNCGVQNIFHVGLLSAIPYLASLIVLQAAAAHGDRTGKLARNYALCSVCAAVGCLTIIASQYHLLLCMVGILLAVVGCVVATPMLSASSTRYLAGRAGAMGFGLMNSIACIGGFICPYLIGHLQDKYQSLLPGLGVVAAIFVIAAILVVVLRPAPPLAPVVDERLPEELVPEP